MKHKNVKIIVTILFCVFLAGCAEDVPAEVPDTGFVVAAPGSYDSEDIAVVVSKDTNDLTITFRNLDLGKNYTLSYTGATTIWDKYGEAMSLDQLGDGSIVDVKFLKEKKRVADIAVYTDSWSYTNVNKYEVNSFTKSFSIAAESFKYTDDTVIVSGGNEIEIMDLNEADTLSVSGIGTTIYSIVVDTGHGYLKLANDEYFVGGWIEVGQSLIKPITDDMLLVVPEGTYQVTFTNGGNSGVKSVTIGRGEEVTVDIGDIEIAEVQYGNVIFTMEPSTASLYVDGSLVDTTTPLTLEYGIHQMIARADGYDTITQYIKVGQASAGVSVSLQSSSEEDDEEKEEDDETVDISSTYKVYIDTPAGVEVYLDSNYIGIAPVSFAKKSGTHTITLRKTGYVTRSYSIEVDTEEKDVTYSFADLVESTE